MSETSNASATRVVAKPGWFDAHLDLAFMAVAGRDMMRAAEAVTPLPIAGFEGRAAVTFPSLAEAPITAAIGTIFIQRRVTDQTAAENVDGPWCYSTPDEAYAAALRQLEIYRGWHDNGVIEIIGGVPSLKRNSSPARITFQDSVTPPRLPILLMLEGAAGIRHLDDLCTFYGAGVRVLSLTWADGSPYAGGNKAPGDITAAGRALVAEMDRLHMVHDVSHLSEQAFWTLLDLTAGPVLATHSNCRRLLQDRETNERNLTDAQIRAVVSRGGVIGLNLYTNFLNTIRRATIDDCVRHLQHIVQLAGRADCIGLGSDMDGGLTADQLPESLDHPRYLHRLAEALADAGFSDDAIAGFRAANFRRFFNRALALSL